MGLNSLELLKEFIHMNMAKTGNTRVKIDK